ncbi:MAG: proline racemase family protein [Candidatus Aerophobetes bacterium]|nr:proline racemase family protein [Candidatus Aerophobetes bacterium]
MRISRMITAVDSHTAGEPTRIVTGGFPYIPGNDMQKKREWMAKNKDYLRKMLMWEPRGHRDMFGAVITEPVSDDADVGVIFMHNGGYEDMCCHGSIGAVTVLVETGMVERENSTRKEKEVILDTPAGKIYSRAKIENGKVREVAIRNVPSFFYSSAGIKVKTVGEVPVDIAYGGNFFALVNAKSLHTKIELKEIRKLIEFGLDIRETVNNEVDIVHPATGKRGKVSLTEIFEETSPPRNAVVFGPGQVDRSPCGTGTCARMATLHAHKRLKVGQMYKYRSIIGTEFYGKIVKETEVGDYEAIVPEVTGSAYITGLQQFVMDEEDPFKYGFQLKI